MIDIGTERIIGFLHVLEFTALVLESNISPNPVQEFSYRLVKRTPSIWS